MGKEGELWDDSALINAFDEAISKYKKMHGKGYKEKPNAGSADVKSSCSVASATLVATQEDNSTPETHDGGNENGSHAIPEAGEAESLETAKGHGVVDSEVSAEQASGSHSLPVQDQSQYDPTSIDMDEYNKLYNQYYEVEEQRQEILQKMQKFSNWNYSYPHEEPVSGLQWGTSAATQEYQSSTSQVTCGTMVVSCCPCACQCSMASCSSLPCPLARDPTCNLCVNSSATNDLRKQPADEDVGIVKMALGAAERAISTLKNKPDSKEKKMDNGAEQSETLETDLGTVLNAWYSAGLYTGKYLAEQSMAKKQHD